MKSIFLSLFVFTLPIHAIIIEDSAERLVFDITWDEGPYRFRDDVRMQGGATGPGGSQIRQLGIVSRNPWQFFFEVRRVVNGTPLAVSAFVVSFRADPEDFSLVPDRTFADLFIGGGIEFAMADPTDSHRAIFVRGTPLPVPDGGSTLLLLLAGLLACSVMRQRHAGRIEKEVTTQGRVV